MKLIINRNPTLQDVSIYSNIRNHKGDIHFIAESEKIVARLLRSDIVIDSLYLTEEHFEHFKELIELHIQDKACIILIASKNEMEQTVGFSLHQGILASAKIPTERTLVEVMAESDHPYLFVVLDEVADAENMGAIFRNSLAMNVTAIIIDKRSVSPWMRRAVRVSMGAVFELPVVTVEFIPETIRKLQKEGIIIYSTTLNSDAESIWDGSFSKDCAIVFGSEGHGIKLEILEACDKEITIPMRDNFHSLNVGTAHGIFLYEVIRQRNLTTD